MKLVYFSTDDSIHIKGSALINREPIEHQAESFIYKPDFNLLQYFIEADRHVTVDGEDFKIGNGTVMHSCVYRPYMSHRPAGKTRAFNIIYNTSPNREVPTEKRLKLPFILDMQDHPTIRYMFEELVYLSMKTGSLDLVKAELILKRILVEMVDYSERSKYMRRAGFNHSIECIEKNLKKNYSIDELADIAGMSRSTYIRHFTRMTGMSVKNYELQTKLRIATTMISTEAGITVKEVSYQLGFCDEFHFSKIYKKYTGKSPSEIRFSGSL